MIRLAHMALLALLVAVALVSYGVKEEVIAKRDELGALKRETAALKSEIATLEVEWRHLTSPAALKALAKKLYGSETFRAADGETLRPWRADRLLDLNAPLSRALGDGPRAAAKE